MLKVEYIDTYKYEIGIPNAMFFLGNMDEMKDDMPIAIFGTGVEAYFTWHFLRARGKNVSCFVNNDSRMEGREFCGIPIVSPQKVVGERYYIVIAMSRLRYDNEVLWQLRVNDHGAWGLTFSERFHKCIQESEGIENLHTVVMKVLNRLWIGEKSIDEVLGRVMNVGNSKNILGIFQEMCWTTTWASSAIEWFYELYANENDKPREMLEIGAGRGTFSMIAKEACPDMDIRWLMYDMNEESSIAVNGRYQEFPANLFSTYYGLIEHPDYRIEDRFDVIVMTEVMEHFALHPVNTIRKIGEMLKPGGRLFLSTPNWGHLPLLENYDQLPEYTTLEDYKARQVGHVYQYSKNELEEIMNRSGLVIERYALSDANSHNLIVRQKED